MKMKQKHLAIAIWLVALVVIAGALLLFESDQLWKVQQKNLFLCSTLFFKDQLVVPGGLLTWVGTWFTQFLYYPWLGVLLLCGWWLGLMAITKRAFRIADRWAILMLIPVAILLIANMDMGYWIYMLKLRGYFFVSTIGATIVAALLWGFRCIPDKYYLRTGYIFVACALGYPLFGIYGLAAALLMGIWSWRLSASRTGAVINSLVAILSVAAVPLFCYRYVYYQINLANVLWPQLPLFFITENHPTYYIPYYLLALFFVILAVTYRADREGGKPMKKLYYLACQVVIAILLVGGVYQFWMKDENFHRELTMQHRIANQDWLGVVEEAAEQQDEPTRAIVMMRNLALSRLGKQGDAMCLYKNGSKAYAAPFGMRLMLVAGPMIYYQYGMLNYCNRLCMEMGVEFGFRTEDYQLLVNCALLEGDKPLARKYINILKQTIFYSDWAEKAETLLNNPKLIAKDAEREPITHMLHYANFIGGDNGYTESFLMTRLVRSKYTDDPIFQEQALLASLYTKDIKQFWYHFNHYVALHPNQRIPRFYQEAAYLYGKLAEDPAVDNMPFDESVKSSFESFMTAASNYDNQTVEVCRAGLYPLFGETYFYDYYMMKNLPEY
jgi:membrane protein YdbS with pleckstrin-like domain